MINFFRSSIDMNAAEHSIRGAMKFDTTSARLNAIMQAYWQTPTEKRDAFVAVLVARLTLVSPSSGDATHSQKEY